MSKRLPHEQKRGSTKQWNYDFISSLSDEVNCPYYLTEQEVQAILTPIDSMGSTHRWQSPTGTTIPVDFIQTLRDNLALKLISDPSCPEDPCEDGCIDYLPNSAFITFAPNDPFRTPDFTPPGYLLPPWYHNPGVPLPGVIPTDAMVNFLGIPNAFAIPTAGFPRTRISWSGSGEVEIEFVLIPQGGLAMITWDDSPLTAQFVDLTSVGLSEILSIGFVLSALGIETDAQVVGTRVQEFKFETPGPHHIDVTFIPNVGIVDEVVVGFGGGIRRVSLCGVMEGTMPNVEFRFIEGCSLEVSYDSGSTFAPVPGWDEFAPDCFTGPAGPQGETGETGPQGETGETGPQGETGPAGESVSTKCRSAWALIEGLWDHTWNSMFQAIDFNITEDEGAAAIKTTIEGYFGVQVDECDLILDNLVSFLLALTEGQFNLFVEANIEDNSQRLELIFGANCWMCDDGGLPENVTAFTDAFTEVIPLGYMEIWSQFYRFALLCNRPKVSLWMSQTFYNPGCIDCDTHEEPVTCEDWTTAIESFVHGFAFYDSADHFEGVATGPDTTVYVADHGFSPINTTGENRACISVFSTTEEFYATQIDIGLEAPYPVDVGFRLLVRNDVTTVFEEYVQNLPSGADFATFPLTTGVLYDQIQIEIFVDDGSPCDEIQASVPVLRYVTVYGVGTDPW